MRAIKVSVHGLLGKLEENRDQHRKDYEDAKAGYLETAKECLQDLLAKVEAGEIINPFLNLTVPDCHLKEYDRAMKMLQWHTEELIELTEDEFAQFVQDDWAWKERWAVSNKSYLTKSRG